MKKSKSFYLNLSLLCITLSYPLFYKGGTGGDSALSLVALGLSLVACVVTIAFC